MFARVRLTLASRSAHTAAVRRREPLDCLPRSLGVHEGHGLVAAGTAAGVTADLLRGDAPVVRKSLEGQVIVLTGAVARADAVLEEDYLIRVVPEAQVPHPHLLPLQVAVAAALGLLAVPPRRSGGAWVTRGAPPSALDHLFPHQRPFFYKKKEKAL